MGQFRIKKIDQGLTDEWVFKINDGASIVGDDIDARDPNELAEALIDTQDIILKTSVLFPGSILKPNSGLAERISILESVAGQSTLQDIYTNGNTIAVTPGSPLIFGTGEEFKLDDSGNLSFKPVTMKVKGSGITTLDLTNNSLTTSFGDLLVGATSPGSKLLLRSENFLYLKDVFLNNPITLSEPSNSTLLTTSQSLVGAINELKAGSFSTNLQSVYAQSNPPKLLTNITQGALIIEDPTPASLADALRVVGNLNVTRKTKTNSISIGNNTSIQDILGYTSSDPITTTNQLRSSHLNAGINDLTFQDKRVSFPLSDNTVTGLSTTRKSIIGAINELYSDIQSTGSSNSIFAAQHDPSTGFHKAITTQAEIGNNIGKRITVKNQTGTNTFSIDGLGHLVASSAQVGGLSVVNLLNDLVSHLSNDGTAHTAFASHLLDSNPHNTVKSILGLAGAVSLASTDGSISIISTGNTIDLKFAAVLTMQHAYNNLITKELNLTSSGFLFKDSASSQPLLSIKNTEIGLKKDINLDYSSSKIRSLDHLEILAGTKVELISSTEDVEIKSLDPLKKVIIQGVDFNEISTNEVPQTLGTSVLGALKTLNGDTEIILNNHFNFPIDFNAPFFIDNNERIWPVIPDFHPANEFLPDVDFFWENKGSIYIPSGTIPEEEDGIFYKGGTRLIKGTSSSVSPLSFRKGTVLYPMNLGYIDLEVEDISSIANNSYLNTHYVLGKELTAITTAGVIDTAEGQFRVEISGSDPMDLKIDKTRNNIIRTINDYQNASLVANVFYLKAGIWGQASKSYISITDEILEDLVNPILTFTQNPSITNASSLSFYAKDIPQNLNDFKASTNPSIVAFSLAQAINKTTFKGELGGFGHKCKAIANGSIIEIEWYMPGKTGNLLSLTSSSPNLETTLMSGGTSVLRLYNMEYSDTPVQVSQGTIPAGTITFSASAFTGKEKIDQYFLAKASAFSSYRNSPFYEGKEIGTIEAISGNTLKVKFKE